MNTPSVDLATCDHATFDRHYLRAFAQRLPFFLRPTLDASPFSIQDIVNVIDAKLFEGNTELPVDARVLRDSRLVRTHIAYLIADQAICLHTDQSKLDDVCAKVRALVDHDRYKKAMLIYMATHPLYRHYKASHYETFENGEAIKGIKITRADQEVLTAVRDCRLPDLLKQNVPELLSLDPDCRVILYAARSRRELKAALADVHELSDTQRDAWCERLFEEWVATTPKAKSGQTSTLEAELDTSVNDDDLSGSVEKIALACSKDEQSFRKFLPLFEEILLKQSLTGKQYQMSIVALTMLLDTYAIAMCDVPTLGIAQLAYGVRFGTKKELLDAI